MVMRVGVPLAIENTQTRNATAKANTNRAIGKATFDVQVRRRIDLSLKRYL